MIYKAQSAATNRTVAIKHIRRSTRTYGEWQAMTREIHAAQKLFHRNIPKFYEVIESGEDIFLVMEYLSGGSLLEYTNKNGHLHELAACEVFAQLIDCLDYLHNIAKVVHRDIKLENIVFDSAMIPKLIDFGFAREVQDPSSVLETMCGSISYTAPEMLKEKKYQMGADIWSLGVVLFALVSGRLPFSNENSPELLKAILTESPVFPKWISSDLRDLLSSMLEKDPSKRITIAEIKTHPWLNSVHVSGLSSDRLFIESLRYVTAAKQSPILDKWIVVARHGTKKSKTTIPFRKFSSPQAHLPSLSASTFI